MPRFDVELTQTGHMSFYCETKEEVARFVESLLDPQGNITSITITKRCESEASSASAATPPSEAT